MDGNHTRDKITTILILLDSVSSHSFSHHQLSTNREERFSVKRVYELMAEYNGILIKSVHADSRVYAEKAFRDELARSNQTINFYGAGANHQKEAVKHHIDRMTRGTRTNLLHAQIRWSEAIGEFLWPYAWKDYGHRCNDIQLDDKGHSPLQTFSRVFEPFKIRDYQTFGCTV